jgi:hypothetical protein
MYTHTHISTSQCLSENLNLTVPSVFLVVKSEGVVHGDWALGYVFSVQRLNPLF